MATTWQNISAVDADDPLVDRVSAGNDSKNWCLFTSSSAEAIKRQHVRETKTPSELNILPTDLEFLPGDVNAGEDDWTILADPE